MTSQPSKFWRALATVLSGSVIAQSVPVIASVFIARIFAPSEFGHFSTWLALVTVLTVILTLRLEKTYVILESKELRTQALLITIAVISGLATLGCIGFLALKLLVGMSFPALMGTLICLGSALTASVQASLAWQAANGYFKSLSICRVVYTTGVAACQIGFGLLYPSSISMVSGYILGQVICILFSFLLVIKLQHSAFEIPRRRDIIFFVTQHKKFPTFSLPADFLNTLIAQFPVVYISNYIGALEAGLYAMSIKVLGAPIGLLGAGVLDVFRRSAAQEFRAEGHCKTSYLRTLKLLISLSVLITVGLFFCIDSIFEVFFGKGWAGSASIATLLLPMFAMRLVASPLSYIVYIADRQHIDLMWQVCLCIMTVSVFLVGSEFEAALWHYSMAYTALYGVYLWMSFRISWGLS